MQGEIINITRFCTDDDPGIRATVFLKGCPGAITRNLKNLVQSVTQMVKKSEEQ